MVGNIILLLLLFIKNISMHISILKDNLIKKYYVKIILMIQYLKGRNKKVPGDGGE